jgi:endonuclease VIII
MEGPSLVILRQEMKPFIEKPILLAKGVTKSLDASEFTGKTIKWIKTWGKHYLMRIGDTVFRTHFLLWGTYRINDLKDRKATLSLKFENGIVEFYSASIRILEQPVDELYDWRVDVMSRTWDKKHVLSLVKSDPRRMICDVILDQNIFAGAGNIIKCEALYLERLFPTLKVSDLSPRKLSALVGQVHDYSHQFYRWKKRYVLRKHWRIYRKGTCPLEHKAKAVVMGKSERYTYYCPICQADKSLKTRSSSRSTL